jgi:hypothetical protein
MSSTVSATMPTPGWPLKKNAAANPDTTNRRKSSYPEG